MRARANPKPYIFAASPSFQHADSPASWAVARAFGWPAFGCPGRLSANTSSSPARPGPASRLPYVRCSARLGSAVEPRWWSTQEVEFVSEVYQPGHGDFILNPLDARCPRWAPWYERRDEIYD